MIIPPKQEYYFYTGKDFSDALHILRKENTSNLPVKSGISKKRRTDFLSTWSVFAPKDTGISAGEEENFQGLVRLCNGDLRIFAGLEAIKSSISGAGD